MTDERRAKIASSEEFIAIVTDNFFDNPAWREDVAVATELGKPITFLLRDGTTVPAGALRGVSRVVRWSNRRDLEVFAADLVSRRGTGIEVVDGALPERKP